MREAVDVALIPLLRQYADIADAGGKSHWATAMRRAVGDITAAAADLEKARAEAHAAVTEAAALEIERDALRARVAGLEASGKLLQQAHSAVLRSLQKQAPCFADTDRLDAMEKQTWTVGHYASGRYFVHLGLINGKQCETTGSALRIAIDEARALLAPSSEETK